MPRSSKRDDRFLVARPEGFPGLAIPLLSDEECHRRGIEPGRFPPRDTWTQEQRDAADGLVNILMPYLVLEVFELVITELEHATSNDVSGGEAEKHAAARALQVLEGGKWKPKETAVHVPASWVRQVLESIARGDVSLTRPLQGRPARRSRVRAKGKGRQASSK